MHLRVWRFITLTLAALGLVMWGAHVLELPEKMKYDAELCAAVTSTLYQQFRTVGAIIQVGGIAAGLALAFMVRRRRGFPRPHLAPWVWWLRWHAGLLSSRP